jgi:hypothetical protein
LRDLWASIPSPSLDAEFVKEMVQQLQGLDDAVNARHHCMGLYHHADLQPEKIPSFRDHTRVGILKIDSMRIGLARYRSVAASIGRPTPPPTGAQYRTITGDPPEAFTSKLREERMPDFCDMWSMGCILLELAVWLLYGYDELKFLNERIAEPKGESKSYFLFEKEDKTRVAKIHPTVRAYTYYISNDPECVGSTVLSDLLEIVKTKLLVVSLPTPRPSSTNLDQGGGTLTVKNIDVIDRLPPGLSRITAQILTKLLDDMMSKGEKNEHYWFSGAPRDDLIRPGAHLILTTSLFSPESVQQQRPKDESGDNSEGLKMQFSGSSEASASTDATETSRLEISTIYLDNDDGDTSSLPEYQLADRKPELRITDPETYFKRLSILEERVKDRSCLWMHSRKSYSRDDYLQKLRAGGSFEEAKSLSLFKASDIWDSTTELWDHVKGLHDLADNPQVAALECLEVIRRCYANPLFLQ